MTTCQACKTQPTTPSSYLCQHCQADFRQLIGSIPITITSLTQVATKTVRLNHDTTPGRSQAFTPLPINETALNLTDQYKQWLQATDSDIQATRGLHDPNQWKYHYNNITCDLTQLLTLAHTPQRYDQLKQLHTQAQHILTPRNLLHFAGICPTCGNPIYTPTNHTTATCPTCGNIINIQTNHAITLNKLRHMHITTTPAGAAQWIRHNTGLPVTRKNIDNWQRRGKLTTQDAGDGYREYNCGQLIDLASQKAKPKRQ